MNISPDLYEYLTNFADDKTILNMLSVNKKFSDDVFFKRVLSRRYPFLLKFKKPNETYKELYLRMIYAIAKLQEKYDIPYIPSPSYDPDNFLNINVLHSEKYNQFHNIYLTVGTEAAKIGRLDLVKQLIQKGAIREDMLAPAAEAGHMNIVKYIFSLGPVDMEMIDHAMAVAGRGGHIDIVEYLVSKGANDFGALLFFATGSDQCDIIKYAIDKGVSDHDIYLAEDETDNEETIECINEAVRNKRR